MTWPLWVLAALSPSLLICVCAWVSILLDRRRRARAEALLRHPSVVGRQLREQRLARDRAPFDGPVFLHAAFTVARPSSAPKRRTRPDRRPDLSHLVRAVEDALTGIVYTDDARIVELSAVKHYPSSGFWSPPFPGVRLIVRPVT